MDWREFVMDWGWLGMAIPLVALVGTTIYSIAQDNKGWKDVRGKIGEGKRASLEEQHENIKETIVDKAGTIERTIERTIVDKTSLIYSKVEQISNITMRNEGRYESLNINQREIRDHVSNLVRDWERVLLENKELRKENQELKERVSSLYNKINQLEHDNGWER